MQRYHYVYEYNMQHCEPIGLPLTVYGIQFSKEAETTTVLKSENAQFQTRNNRIFCIRSKKTLKLKPLGQYVMHGFTCLLT